MKQNSKSLPVQMSNATVITLKNHILKVTVNRCQWYSAFELHILQRELIHSAQKVMNLIVNYSQLLQLNVTL
jgi:hypothetical protein